MLQAVWRCRLRQERLGAGPSTLSLPRLWLSFHGHAITGQASAMKALAVLLYGMGNMSFSMIGHLLGVSDVAVLKWVRAKASALPEPEVPAEVVTVAMDEMWHFIKKVCQTLDLARL